MNSRQGQREEAGVTSSEVLAGNDETDTPAKQIFKTAKKLQDRD